MQKEKTFNKDIEEKKWREAATAVGEAVWWGVCGYGCVGGVGGGVGRG